MVTDISHFSLRPLQEFVGDRVKQVEHFNETVQESISRSIAGTGHLGQRIVRTGIGFGALAFDQASASLHASRNLLQKAEKKGEGLEHTLTTQMGDRVNQLEEQAGAELRRLNAQLKDNPAVAGGKRLNQQLDVMFSAIMPGPEAENSVIVTPTTVTPLVDYDELNVSQVKSRSATMTIGELEALRRYEGEHKARVTVLEAIDSQIKAKLVIA